MPPPRISIASLLGIIALIALGLAGIVSATTLWTSVAATLTLALLLAAMLAACSLDGTDRAFWAGFALFGWTYILLVNWDWVGGQFGHDLTAGLGDLAESIVAPVPVPVSAPSPRVTMPPFSSAGGRAPLTLPGLASPDHIELVRQRQVKIGNFVQIGRQFLALGFGLMGGIIATRFARRRESEARAPECASSPAADRGGG